MPTRLTDLIQPHKTWKILDSSKLNTYLDCPRRFMYEYVLGWRPEGENNHLEFGSAWHKAMEHLLLNQERRLAEPEKVAVEAFDAFMTRYRETMPDSLDAANEPKNPAGALRSLLSYVERYRDDSFKVHYTEVAGTVPVGEDSDGIRLLHFRLDSVCEDPGDGVFSLEHKTGSQLSRQWTDQWLLATQTSTYTHVLRCIFPKEQVYGVKINGAIIRKKDTEFIRVPVRKSDSIMNAWMWEVNHYIDMLKWNMNMLLEESSVDDPILTAFPKNPQACTKYFGCPFLPYCQNWANPLQRVEAPPMGFKQEWWNPADEETKVRPENIMHLEGVKKDG